MASETILRRVITPETFERWAKAEENAVWISAGGAEDSPAVTFVMNEAEGVDTSGIEDFVAIAAQRRREKVAAMLAELDEDDDFGDVVLEPRQCSVGDGEACESCQ